MIGDEGWGSGMFVLPDGSAISKEVRPCRCGCDEWLVIESAATLSRLAIWCRDCYPKRDRRKAKPDERIVGRLDTGNWRIVVDGGRRTI